MVTGPLLIVIFIVSLAFLLVTIIKFKLNAFVSLIITSFLTALLVRMPFGDITSAVADGFSGTIGGIGIVTGMGVMLGMLLFESGGINAIADKMIHLFGEKNSPAGLGIAAYFAGIPVFGDVVTVLFSTMVRALSRKTNISRLSFVSCYAVAASITAACVIPTAGPLAVCENMELNIGVFFVYSTLAGLVGFLTGGILWGKYLDRKEKKSGYVRVLDEFELEEQKTMEKEESSDKKISFGAAMLILLIPILMIVIGSFASVLLPENNGAVPYLAFIGNKNLAMAVGVLCAMLIAKPYIKGSMSEIMGARPGSGGYDSADYRCRRSVRKGNSADRYRRLYGSGIWKSPHSCAYTGICAGTDHPLGSGVDHSGHHNYFGNPLFNSYCSRYFAYTGSSCHLCRGSGSVSSE